MTRFRAGDRVMATLAYGGLAEQAVAKEAETFAVPEGMPFEEAGAFPISYISSDVALRWQGRLEPGETLLVLGSAGGVGLTAVEIGKAMGARVIAGASTAEKLAVAREHGADDLIDYTTEKLTDRVMALTGDKGADVCFDPSGRAVGCRAVLARLGRALLLVGFVGGVQQIPANRLLVKHRAALGCSLRYYRWHAPDKLLRSVEELCGGIGRAGSSRASPTACRSSRAPRPSGSSPTARHTARSSSCRASPADRGAPPPWRSASRRTARTSPSSRSTTSPAVMP